MTKRDKKWKIIKIIIGALLALIAVLNMAFQWLLGADSFVSDRELKTQEWASIFVLLIGLFIIYKAGSKKSSQK